jgi:thioredoxin-like negative regulator of GroEL
MNKLIPALSILFFLSATGCASFPGPRPVTVPEPKDVTEPLMPAHILDQKIDSLKKRLETGDLSETQREVTVQLMKDYNSIQNLPTPLTKMEYREVIETLFHGLTLLEESYLSNPLDVFARKRAEILEAYLAADFKGVVDGCLELEKRFGQRAFTPEITLLLTLSLARQGKTDEAMDLGNGLIHKLEGSPDLLDLRERMAEWQLEKGQREAAVDSYKKLSRELDQHTASLHALGRRIEETPQTGAVIKEDDLRTPVETEGSTHEAIGKAEELVQEQRFGAARDLLVSKREQVPPGPEATAIDDALRDVERAEDKYLQERITMLSSVNEGLTQAKKLIEEEKFEDALSKLQAMSPEYGNSQKIEALKKEAVDGLVNRERNRAAEIFLAAKKTRDPVKREENLRISYSILKNAIEKYPSSSLNDKLKSHMEKVAEELEKLGKSVD